MTASLLVATVAAVGVLHTLVPDHWAPIVVVGRQRGWSVAHTARAAAVAGLGHVTSTLVLGIIAWAVGASLSVGYGHAVSVVAAVALILFGAWIGYTGWREVSAGHDHAHPTAGHAHLHSHGDVAGHVHWHEHDERGFHPVDGGAAVAHDHGHAVAGRTALLLILGSSPMIEGLPAFFAASTYGPALLGVMAGVFALATIATYVVASGFAMAGLQRLSFGPLERYGEVLSGAVVALVGVYALLTA
jgi:hypothetical protein